MKLIKELVLVCLFLTCFFSCKNETNTSVAEDTKTEYAKFVDAMKAEGMSTGNILVYEKGEVVFKSSNGLRSINPIDSLDIDSQFRLASVSKQFTGMAIMKLKEAGKLEYDQKVNTILVDFPYNNITVRQLLHHTSGLTDYERLIAQNFVKEDSTKQYILGNDEILKEYYRVDPELDFHPGEKWEYSNTGYLVLASIVEKVSGLHFRDFLKEHITDPIGMNSTTLYSYQMDTDPQMPNRVFGYDLALNQKDLISDDYNIVNDVRGDGGIYSTLEDLYKWNMALANHTIISKDYLDEAWISGKTKDGEDTGYGFGWFLEQDETKPQTVFHSGGWVGFVTFLHNEVGTKSGFIILTNDSGLNFGSIYNNIKNLRAGESYQMPKKSVYKAMAKTIYENDVNEAITFYKRIKTDTINYRVNESDINRLGYLLINEGNIDAATEIFKLNISEYPKSANVYDSYGDALLMQGDSIQALANFQMCYQMDDSLMYAKDKADALENALKN